MNRLKEELIDIINTARFSEIDNRLKEEIWDKTKELELKYKNKVAITPKIRNEYGTPTLGFYLQFSDEKFQNWYMLGND